MYISCCAWGLPGSESDVLRTLSKLPCSSIDIQSGTYLNQHSSGISEKYQNKKSCIGLSFNMPKSASLDSPYREKRRAALSHIKYGIDQASKSGIDTAYIIPDFSYEQISFFNDSLLKSADLAKAAGIKLCVEHFPQRSLPTASKTLKHLQELNHPNLYLLLDVGHLQISNEDPQHIVESAGKRLGYVHLDDNDGKNDSHWALCTGIMTLNSLKKLVKTLQSSSYSGALSIELNPRLSAPVKALQESLYILQSILRS